MKIVLVGLNSSYSHSNLALEFIKSYNSNYDMEILTFTVNQNLEYILEKICETSPDYVGFSTYIFNVNEVLKLASDLKKAMPDVLIAMGGPEVSYSTLEFMNDYNFVDFVISGEGEIPTGKLFDAINGKCDFKDVPALTYRENGEILINKNWAMVSNLDEIPSPYKDMDYSREKIVYYEASRGCPFSCAFCLSAMSGKLRFFSANRIKSDLKYIFESPARIIKFTDRTFNAKESWTMEIMDFIEKNAPEHQVYHLEIYADILSDRLLEFLKHRRKGLFQLEIGVQSTNQKTLKAVGRNTNIKRLKYAVKKIMSYDNMHIHLDLIAGLPYEDYKSFRNSFNEVYSMDAEKIQLGFLKVLKGSIMENIANEHEIIYRDYAPYEVISTKYISSFEIMLLKNIEDVVEKFHNEDYFYNAINYIIESFFETPFDFFESLGKYWKEKDFRRKLHSRASLYEILWQYYLDNNFPNSDYFNSLLIYDFCLNNKRLPPKFSKPELLKKRAVYNYLRDVLKYDANRAKRIGADLFLIKFPYDIMENDIVKQNTFILFDHNKERIETIKIDTEIGEKISE
ncbi:MAG: DUF4080 domain-containing protein [Tissierellia bacterium]|nr:DUF4080 domain-containing protein [Tissierellia bacterium]